MSFPFLRILVALDGSGLAEVALPVAVAFAQADGSEVTLLHVVEPDAPAKIHGDRHLQSQFEAATYLDELANRLRTEGVTVNTDVESEEGRGVAPTINAAAETLGSDLVILATHGQGGIRDLLFGRVAQKVVQLATRPLVIVPATRGGGAYDCTTMVLPLDGSQEAETALPVAQSIVDVFDCGIVLVRVVPTRESLQGAEAAVGSLLPGATKTVLNFEVDEAGWYLSETAATWFPNRAVSLELRRGPVETEIVQTLVQHNADLVVMSTHGRGGLTALLEGSIGHHILSRSICPILLLRLPSLRPPASA